MFIDLSSFAAWDDLNEKVQITLGISERVQCFGSSRQALYEITQSLTQFMTHKRAIGMITGLSPAFHEHLPYYMREGVEIQKSSYKSSIPLKEWVEALKKDTNFVVFAADHPVTGEVFEQADELEMLLNNKRIFAIRVFHRPRILEDNQCGAYSVHIHAYKNSCALAVLGNRYRAPHLAAHLQNWDPKNFVHLQVLTRVADQKTVELFEAQFLDNVFIKGTAHSRNFDRAILVFPDVNADALFAKLKKHLPESLHEGLLTTSSCDLGNLKLFKNWWEPAPSEEVLRGLCIFSLDVLNTKDFANTLKTSYEELKSEQSWVV